MFSDDLEAGYHKRFLDVIDDIKKTNSTVRSNLENTRSDDVEFVPILSSSDGRRSRRIDIEDYLIDSGDEAVDIGLGGTAGGGLRSGLGVGGGPGPGVDTVMDSVEIYQFYDSDSPITITSQHYHDDDYDNCSIEHLSNPDYRRIDQKERSVSRLRDTGRGRSETRSRDFPGMKTENENENVKNEMSENESEHMKIIKTANQLEILITYLKGQAHLYSVSQYLTQHKILMLTVPSFAFSVVVAVISPIIHDYLWSGILISTLTTTIATLFACVRNFELDAAATTYLSLTNQYKRMQISLETVSNAIIIGNEYDSNYIMSKIRTVENSITDIRESNVWLPPEEVKTIIPIISHINIFSFIKKIEFLKHEKIKRYEEIKREMRVIMRMWENYDSDPNVGGFGTAVAGGDVGGSGLGGVGGGIGVDEDMSNAAHKQHWKKQHSQWKREKMRMDHLLREKSEIRNEMKYYNSAYSYIDELFTREINIADKTNIWTFFFRSCFGFPDPVLPGLNPVVDKYLDFIFNKPSYTSTR